MTKMAAMAINSKNLLFQNQKAYDFETWHEASGNGALQSLYTVLLHVLDTVFLPILSCTKFGAYYRGEH